MTKYFAMSDIHAQLDSFEESLKLIDLEDKDNYLILLGDYINRGPSSYSVLQRVMELEKIYTAERVITLVGNHDLMFLDWLNDYKKFEIMISDFGLNTIASFFSKDEFDSIKKEIVPMISKPLEVSKYLIELLYNQHSEIISWLFGIKKNYYYETDTAIYVHAGIFEEEDYWQLISSREQFTQKYPAKIGKFYKDIIAGHVHSEEVAQDESYLGKVFYDDYSHYYIDGHTNLSSVVPILKYDTETRLYSSFVKTPENWEEYVMEKK